MTLVRFIMRNTYQYKQTSVIELDGMSIIPAFKRQYLIVISAIWGSDTHINGRLVE